MKNIKKFILFVAIMIVVGGVNIYAATVGDQLLQPEEGWQRYDDTNKYIIYEGDNWAIGGTSNTAYGGSNHHILRGLSADKIKLHKVKFNFIGTKIRLIGNLDVEHTKQLKIKIDGELIGAFNAWKRGTFQSHTVIIEKTGLENGIHSIEIYSDDEGRYNCDAIDIDKNGSLLDQNQLEAPSNLLATPSTNNIILNWNVVERSDSYSILRSTTSDAIDTVIASNVTETTYIDNNVEPGVTYYYVVRAVKNGVESDNSNIASAMIENINTAVLQIKLSTTDIYEYRITMNQADNFIKWYIDRANGTGLPFYSFSDESKIEPYTDINEYLIFDKIVWFKVKEYLK
ncbi:fibronectin type III domain-containing protein [Vallitalea guaymasensis]|uniref:fibronectin type III domain-containing protein n=1 Tax=Vallitalea guaymasensis TaxID=1185412 RepID=UPI0023531D0E|nr:fibronectin type III domain-containing protein [Vallitalea guaymasensis]